MKVQCTLGNLPIPLHTHLQEVQGTDGVSYTSIDVTGVVMEKNPAYGTVPIRMGETDMAGMFV